MNYHLQNIRTLLTEGFSEAELRAFCFDTPEFRPAHHELADLSGKAAIVSKLLEFAVRRELLNLLLDWARVNNLAKYTRYQPYKKESPLSPVIQEAPQPIIAVPSSKEKPLEKWGTPIFTPTQSDLLTITHPIYLELIRIPAGEFLMGSDPKKDKSAGVMERPQHRVYVSEFYVSKFPITNEQYTAFVQAIRYRLPRHWNNAQGPTGKENHPVVNISWDDAITFCEWLSRESVHTVRLPTEAEWEKAARGPDGRIYPWGNDWESNRLNTGSGWKGLASIITSVAISTTSVGHYSPRGDSPYGVADMCGNVWEWCADWYDGGEYQRRVKPVVEEPRGPPQGQDRVLRGGSWNNTSIYARCACRSSSHPLLINNDRGMRVVISPI